MYGSRSDEPPNGFQNLYEKSPTNKVVTYIRCTKKAYDPILKKYVQCLFKLRKDHYKGKPHKCLFSNLDSFITKKKSIIVETKDELIQTVFKFVGKKNISISTAVSDDFSCLLKTFYEFGQNNLGKNFETAYNQMSRSTFTKKFIIHSEHKKLELLRKYVGYACLAIDGGKIGSNSILNCIILNPLKAYLPPLLYDSIYDFPGNCESYTHEVTRIIGELEESNI